MMDIFMKIDPHILKFPRSLPNDEQQFMTYYPYKFPKVIEYFEQKAQELYDKPEAYAQFVQDEFKILEAAVNKVNDEYKAGNQTDLAFLIEIDQKFNKIFCFKFWVINYVFADGPLHEFYVDQLKAFARKMVDVSDDIEEYEQRIIQIQRDLLQTDYADIYLVQALHGVIIMDFLENDEFSKQILDTITPLIDEHTDQNNKKILELWKPIVDRMLDDSDNHYDVLRIRDANAPYYTLLDLAPLQLPRNQVRMRHSQFPLFSFLNHTVEFRRQNEALKERHRTMKQTIEDIFDEAKLALSEEEYTDFRLSYEMSKAFSMSKDIMGEVDPILVPVWERDVHGKVYAKLLETQEVRYPSVNHASMFGSFAWYLPDNLKAKVMSVDTTDFNIEEL
jgi:hypothetical protein